MSDLTIISETTLHKVKKFTGTPLGIFFLGSFVSHLLQGVFAGVVEYSLNISIFYHELPRKLFIDASVGIVFFVIHIHKNSKDIVKDLEILHKKVSHIFQKTFPKIKELLNKVDNKCEMSKLDKSTLNATQNKTDPKLFSALDYGCKIVDMSPPSIHLDDDHINEIFNEDVTGIYTLWTEELSVWLDPMMQFYFTNLGLRSLINYVNTKSSSVSFFDMQGRNSSTTPEYAAFKTQQDRVLRTFAKNVPFDERHMIRLVILKKDWDKVYQEELAMMYALCELYHYPCLFLKQEDADNYIERSRVLEVTELNNNLTMMSSLIKSTINDSTDERYNLSFVNGKLNVIGFVAFATKAGPSKFYILSHDPRKPIYEITDNSQVAINVFRKLIGVHLGLNNAWQPSIHEHINKQNTIIF